MSDMIICCEKCQHSFDAMDERAWISPRGDGGGPLCPYCAMVVLNSREAWSVWNSCNGIFNCIVGRRSEAEKILKDEYDGLDAKVIPVRVCYEADDHEVMMRNWIESREYPEIKAL